MTAAAQGGDVPATPSVVFVSHERGSPLSLTHSLSRLAATCLAQEAHIARLLRGPRAAQQNAINLASCKTLAKAGGKQVLLEHRRRTALCASTRTELAPLLHRGIERCRNHR